MQEPLIPPDLVNRLLDGEHDAQDVSTALTALMWLCDAFVEVCRDGVSDRDYPYMERVKATSTVIDSEFLAKSIAEHRARQAQTRIPFVFGYAGAASPLTEV